MYATTTALPLQQPPETCTQGHRSTLILPTAEGGSICLLCLSNLLSNPKSPTVHLSYALSQLSQALSQPQFFHSLLTLHSHFLISPLVSVLSNFDDEPIAKQTIDLIQRLCDVSSSSGNGNEEVRREFVARVSDWLSSGSLAWSRRQLYMLHCFGVLLDNQDCNLYGCIKNKDILVFNLVSGLQLSNDEIQGEIMFVLYRSSVLHYTYIGDDGADILLAYCPKILHISLDILMKSQSDDVRLNCVAFLTVLAQRGFFQSACSDHVWSTDTFVADNFMQKTEHVIDGPPLEVLFSEAVKGPLLSSDSQVQIATLDLIFRYLSSADVSGKECQVFVEQNIADYIFEILRLSGSKDPIVNSSIQVLDLLSNAEGAFRQRLAIGFSTLVPILRYVAEIPFQPVQYRLLKLMLDCILNCPGIVSACSGEEIASILVGMLIKHIDMLPETFSLSCSILVAIMKCSSSRGNESLAASVKDASQSAASICLDNVQTETDQILHFLYLVKEAYTFAQEDNFSISSNVGLRVCIIDILKLQILPWFMTVINDVEEAIILGVIETLHSILLQDPNDDTKNFAESLVSSSWFSALFGCLGLFPSEKMKWRVYLIFSSIVDVLLGVDSGQPIRDAALHLPADPTDLLFLLGQKSIHNLELLSCQSGVLLVLYVSSLYNDRIADDKLVLASLEQFILLNSSDFLCGACESVTIELLVNLYGLYRGYAKLSYQIPYSPEAERILFQLLADKDWDSLSTKIHLTSLRWLFQQEKLCKPLSDQILKFCRCNGSIGDNIVHYHETRQKVNLHAFAELITSGDNFGAMTFVCLLGELVENACEECDIISVLKACKEIIEIAPVASDHFCMHGMDGVLQSIYNYSIYDFPELFMATSQLVFSTLQSVHSESISGGEAWVGITVKLMDYMFSAVASDGWTEEVLTIVGILTLILHHSTKEALVEASKTIILNVPLVSTINNIISEACSKGPALSDHDEGTRTGDVLIFVLLLLCFSLRSIRAILPGIIDFQILLDEGQNMQPLSYVSIRCHDLCKLMHFGSAPVKLIASFCLVELFNGISDYTSRTLVDLKLREGYLSSISAVLEGLIFFNDIRVALNCSLCFSSLTTWRELQVEPMILQKDHWCRLIVEELVMSLSTPSLTTKSLMIHHKPAANVAVALLKLSETPSWMTKVFDDSSIQSIIQNISPSDVNTELVILFRELLVSGHMNPSHISDLNRVFQACRRQVYTDDNQDSSIEDHMQHVAVNLDHVGKTRTFLFSLVSAHSYPGCYLWRSQSRKKELLEEIELFTKCLMEEDEV
ncbi:UNVERIFIED_CONTAM: protein putative RECOMBINATION INITIATION DEFECT 1 [Sesamum calycinum]|uniref:Protein putative RECOMBINATION INITIATION DEFECT 1 n=1 Tax=Sesamum calycinum TaxID=2727403 RepID=A0AAW2RTX1_9LAMI